MNMCTKFQVTENMLKTVTFHVISGLYRDFPNVIFSDFDASKSVLGSFFVFFAKI